MCVIHYKISWVIVIKKYVIVLVWLFDKHVFLYIINHK